MSRPTIWQHMRQTLGRALRETGQALDRTAVKTIMLSKTANDFYDEPCLYEDDLSRHRNKMPLLWAGQPQIASNVAFIAPCATLIGSVTVENGASIWYGSVLRADTCANAGSYKRQHQRKNDDHDDDDDEHSNDDSLWDLDKDQANRRSHHVGGGIHIGANSNIQDGAIITARTHHSKIGTGVTVGHMAQIHSATVGDYALIGMGSILQEGAVVESEAFIAAGAVIAPDTVVPAGELWAGNPAKKLRDLTPEQREKLHYQSSEYVAVAQRHQPVMELGGNLPESLLEAAEQQAYEEPELLEPGGGDDIQQDTNPSRDAAPQLDPPDEAKLISEDTKR